MRLNQMNEYEKKLEAHNESLMRDIERVTVVNDRISKIVHKKLQQIQDEYERQLKVRVRQRKLDNLYHFKRELLEELIDELEKV